jgi:hypothetical protein
MHIPRILENALLLLPCLLVECKICWPFISCLWKFTIFVKGFLVLMQDVYVLLQCCKKGIKKTAHSVNNPARIVTTEARYATGLLVFLQSLSIFAKKNYDAILNVLY